MSSNKNLSEKNKVFYYLNDIPNDLNLGTIIAIDTEAMGLKTKRDRLCLIQICDAYGNIHLIHFPEKNYNYDCPNLKKIFMNDDIEKIFHYARFDVSIIRHYLKLDSFKNIFCTKIASKFTRTYTDSHSLRSLVNEICSKELKKEQTCTNWGSVSLSTDQKQYAVNDVLYLHEIKENLEKRLINYNRYEIAKKYFEFLDIVCTADLMDFTEDIFSFM